MYTREEYEEIQGLRYVHHEITPLTDGLPEGFRILKEVIGSKVKGYHPQHLVTLVGFGGIQAWVYYYDERRRSVTFADYEEARAFILNQAK